MRRDSEGAAWLRGRGVAQRVRRGSEGAAWLRLRVRRGSDEAAAWHRLRVRRGSDKGAAWFRQGCVVAQTRVCTAGLRQ